MACSVEDCDRIVYGLGLCAAHYQRQRTGRPLEGPIQKRAQNATPPLERIFLRCVWKDGCLVWTGATQHGGYGEVKIDRKPVRTHRYVYERLVGPVPPGYEVCHHCDNPPCCRPEHLFVGTRTDNASDMRAKGRGGNQHGSFGTH